MTLIIDIIEGFTIIPGSRSDKSTVVTPPSITGDTEAYTGDDVTLTASGSVSAFGTSIEYTWILPDGSTEVGNTLDFHVPEDTESHSTITIRCFAKDTLDNESQRSIKMITAYDVNMPVIDTISWDDSDHWEEQSYVLIIGATDPNGLSITYDVTCDDETVDIVQRDAPNEHIFDITYGEYTADAGVVYSVTVTNANTLTDVGNESIMVHDNSPTVDTVGWDVDEHLESHSYVLTVGATDPNSLDLTYDVVCDDEDVTIVQRADPDEHIFDITYGEYTESTDITYTISITNTNDLSGEVTEVVAIQKAIPVINNIYWDDNSQWEGGSYVLTIAAVDPNALDLTYEVICDDGTVGIVQRADPNEHIFDIDYGAYAEDTDLTYTITVTNTDALDSVVSREIIVHDANPIISNITWDDDDQYEDESYVMTIGATDPQDQDLTYDVTCDDGTVGIVQQGTTNVFDITYGAYTADDDLTFTITVTNTDTLTDVETEIVTVHNVDPVVNSITWDNDEHRESASRVMTIDATDPAGLDLTYEVECTGVVTIVQRAAPNEHIFDITYGEYETNTAVMYTVTVTNTDTLTGSKTNTVNVLTNHPNVDGITWNNSTHYEVTSYAASIIANDPQDQDLTYEMTCDDGTVIINQRAAPNEHIFDITYDEYAEDTDVTFSVTVTNEDEMTDDYETTKTVHDGNPIISDVSWDDSDHYENESYVMTITATDPQSQDLTYDVICDDVTVDIAQRISPNEHIFDITYDEYSDDVDVEYTITVTNEDTLTDVETEIIIAHNEAEARAVFGGGWSGTNLAHNTIDYVTVGTIGNATDFGDLRNTRRVTSATSNGANDRGVFAGGLNQSGSTATCTDTIDYITISATGNALDFGNLTQAMNDMGIVSNGTNNRGVFGCGRTDCSYASTIISYITISTPGNATSFGSSTVSRRSVAGASNGINNRGVFAGGKLQTDTAVNTIDYITISTPGNATDFGNLTAARSDSAGTSNDINDRGIFAGGWSGTPDAIDYVTISSTGNATTFGNMTSIKQFHTAASNGVGDRGVIGGGRNVSDVYLNDIDYVTISTPGNATDFGNLTAARCYFAATSNA